MAAIVISNSDSEFELNVQEATKRSLMTATVTCQGSALYRWLTLVPSPLLAFRGEPRNETKLVISWKQYRGLDSGR